jgi:hypothetical protein
MSDETINPLVSQLTSGTLDVARLQAALATTFRQTDENPYWTFYEFDLSDSSFARGEFRQGKEAGRALLSLWAREASPVLEEALNLNQWGEVTNIDINPRIPPEGTDAYSYNVNGVKVSFQFTHASRKLRSVALEWGEAEVK